MDNMKTWNALFLLACLGGLLYFYSISSFIIAGLFAIPGLLLAIYCGKKYLESTWFGMLIVLLFFSAIILSASK
jgi:hypothetical protein